MIVVSDTSPVSNLIVIGRLDILKEVFTDVLIPPSVDREIQALSKFGQNLQEYENADWIKVVQPEDAPKLASLRITLDDGEAEAIALALEVDCGLLLMDERIGTTIARREGLQTIGLIGVLIKAKEIGVIDRVSSILGELRDRAGFWVGKNLEQRILSELNEDYTGT